jgi:hypothetical protein
VNHGRPHKCRAPNLGSMQGPDSAHPYMEFTKVANYLTLKISRSRITTNSQSASQSWCQAPIWGPRLILLSPWNFLQAVACLLFCSALSDERMGLWFTCTIASAPCQSSHSWVCPLWWEDESVIYLYNCFWALPEQSLLGRSPAELTAIFYCLIWDSPNLEGQVPAFISPKEQAGPVIPPGTGFPFCRLLRLAETTVEVF